VCVYYAAQYTAGLSVTDRSGWAWVGCLYGGMGGWVCDYVETSIVVAGWPAGLAPQVNVILCEVDQLCPRLNRHRSRPVAPSD